MSVILSSPEMGESDGSSDLGETRKTEARVGTGWDSATVRHQPKDPTCELVLKNRVALGVPLRHVRSYQWVLLKIVQRPLSPDSEDKRNGVTLHELDHPAFEVRICCEPGGPEDVADDPPLCIVRHGVGIRRHEDAIVRARAFVQVAQHCPVTFGVGRCIEINWRRH